MLVDVSGEEPWSIAPAVGDAGDPSSASTAGRRSLRAGRAARTRAGPRRGRGRAAGRRAQPAGHRRPHGRLRRSRFRSSPGSDGAGSSPRHGRGGRHPALAPLGRAAKTPRARASRSSAARRTGRTPSSSWYRRRTSSRGPNALSWHEAAAFPLAALTAWRALFTQGAARAGRDGARPRRRERRLDVPRPARRRARAPASSSRRPPRPRSSGRRSSARRPASTTPPATGSRPCGSSPAARASTSSSTPSGGPGPTRCAACGPGGRVRRLRRHRGNQRRARGAPRVPAPALDPRHDDGQPARVRGPARRARARARGRRSSTRVHPLADAAAAHARIESAEHFGKLVLEIA